MEQKRKRIYKPSPLQKARMLNEMYKGTNIKFTSKDFVESNKKD